MGKNNSSKKRKNSRYIDPALDQITPVDAKSMLFSNMISMGWRLAIMVLLPIFIGVQIDRRLDSSPSVTLAAFFIAVFGAGLLIYRSYKELNTELLQDEQKKSKRRRKIKEDISA